jgi:hypothetical protein
VHVGVDDPPVERFCLGATDRAETPVVRDDHGEVELMFYSRGQLEGRHHIAAIAAYGNDLTVGAPELCTDGGRKGETQRDGVTGVEEISWAVDRKLIEGAIPDRGDVDDEDRIILDLISDVGDEFQGRARIDHVRSDGSYALGPFSVDGLRPG